MGVEVEVEGSWLDLRRGGFHRAKNNGGAHNGFTKLIEFAVASPDVGTAGMKTRVSASCYRRLFAAVLFVLLNLRLTEVIQSTTDERVRYRRLEQLYSGQSRLWWLIELMAFLCLPCW